MKEAKWLSHTIKQLYIFKSLESHRIHVWKEQNELLLFLSSYARHDIHNEHVRGEATTSPLRLMANLSGENSEVRETVFDNTSQYLQSVRIRHSKFWFLENYMLALIL